MSTFEKMKLLITIEKLSHAGIISELSYSDSCAIIDDPKYEEALRKYEREFFN